jgi:hypothetical protein
MSSRLSITALFTLLAFAPLVQGQQPAPARDPGAATSASATAPAGVATKAITVFLDASFGGRTNGAAKALSNKHAEMEAQGWRFEHLAVYTENGDLVGFFVTYVRDARS